MRGDARRSITLSRRRHMRSLNPPQREAVAYVDGPLLVLAGAGSGKTQVITQKIAHLIGKHGIEPDHIAAITFTNKAAREMQQRLRKQIDRAADVRVSTFHTLGLSIIRDDPEECGLRPRFTILSQSDAIGVLEDLIRAGFDNDAVRAEAMLASISAWKNRLLDPQQALEDAAGQPLETAAARCYGQYQERLEAWNAVDFDDLIMRPARALARNDALRGGWQHRIRYLLIDEYQDTNAAQYELVKLLAGSAARITAVGDDDQSIYAWRGARPENLALLKRDYEQLKVVKLEQNYRSTGTILKAANVLIANNDHLFEKRLWTDSGFGDPIRVMRCSDEADEAARVADMIAYQRVVKRRGFGDFAILYRGNYQARVFEQALRERRIPYFVSGGPSFFDLAEVKDVLAYLRIAANGDDDNAFGKFHQIESGSPSSSIIPVLSANFSIGTPALFNNVR